MFRLSIGNGNYRFHSLQRAFPDTLKKVWRSKNESVSVFIFCCVCFCRRPIAGCLRSKKALQYQSTTTKSAATHRWRHQIWRVDRQGNLPARPRTISDTAYGDEIPTFRRWFILQRTRPAAAGAKSSQPPYLQAKKRRPGLSKAIVPPGKTRKRRATRLVFFLFMPKMDVCTKRTSSKISP